MTPDGARELETLAQQVGAVHGVSFIYRQFAAMWQAASMVRGGSVGRLFAVQRDHLWDWILLEADCNWRIDATQDRNSWAVADIGSH